MPGISRSGSTIAAGLLSGVEPSKAAEFSFLLAIPAIGGATILKIRDLAALDAAHLGPYLAGSAVSFVFGLAAVYLVLSAIRRGKFEYFAYYCFAVGAIGLYLLL
jgi:undecaprenyl-diphosphatase